MTGERFKALIAEYGRIALGTYFGLFALTLIGFLVAITMGFSVEGAASGVGAFGAAYLATKVTQPLRIAGTVLLTPIVARFVHRRRPVKAEAPAVSPEPAVVNDERAE